MSNEERWKWELDPDEFHGRQERQEWEELKEEANREEEKHSKRLEEDYYLDLFPEEENE